MPFSEQLAKIHNDLKSLRGQMNQLTDKTVEILKEIKNDLAESNKNQEALNRITQLKQRIGGQKNEMDL